MKRMETVLIFRERLLAPSETFIAEQAKALRRYRPVLVGLRRTEPSLRHTLPEILLRDGDGPIDRFSASLYRKFPAGPGFFERLRSVNPSLIHAHFAIDAVQAIPIACKLKLPLVVSLHGFDVTSNDRALGTSRAGRHYVKHRERLFREATAFLCVSRFIRDAARKAGFPEAKLHVHYTGIDCERFRPSEVPRDAKRILFVGRLQEVKGCEYLLRAAALLYRHDRAVRVEIIGDGPLRGKLEAMAASLRLPVEFRGAQSQEEVQRSMAQARVLCNPSVTASSGSMEGFGMVFAEAQAVGTPVVSFCHAGIPEAVSHGQTGLLCPEGDVVALSKSLKRLLDDDELWASMSRAARSRVTEQFDAAKQAEKLEGLYDDFVAQYRRAEAERAETNGWRAGGKAALRA